MDSMSFTRTAAFAGGVSALLLSGINFSASQLTLPILYRLPAVTSTSVFEELFYRGGWVIVPLTIFSTLSTGLTAYYEPAQRAGFAAAAVASFASLPWTALIMRPTIQSLCKLANDEKFRQKVEGKEVVSLLKRWRWMNFVRAGLAAIGGATGLAVLAGGL
jgi:Domain of unknown function (DUF1772)